MLKRSMSRLKKIISDLQDAVQSIATRFVKVGLGDIPSRYRMGFAVIELFVEVYVQVNGYARQTRLIAITPSIAVEIQPFDAAH